MHKALPAAKLDHRVEGPVGRTLRRRRGGAAARLHRIGLVRLAALPARHRREHRAREDAGAHQGAQAERAERHRRRAWRKSARRSTAGKFKWRTDLEDVHMNIEAELTARCPAGAKLHTGRSRNDQVATAMRLWLKDQIAANRRGDRRAAGARWRRGPRAIIDVVIPGYTHLQRAQPVLLAHHLLAYVEMLERDYERLADCAEAGRCPAARLRRDCGQHAAARPRVRARSCSASRASRKTRWMR